MIAQGLIEVIEKLQKFCEKHKLKIAFMGGIAVSVYGLPRTTYDVDGVILLGMDKLGAVLPRLKKMGFRYDQRSPVKLIRGKSFVSLLYRKYRVYVDIFLAQSDHEKLILSRAKRIKFNRNKICIVSPEDLILIKLQAGRERDTEDVREIILESAKKLDFAYLKKWAKKLGIGHFLSDELESLGVKQGGNK